MKENQRNQQSEKKRGNIDRGAEVGTEEGTGVRTGVRTGARTGARTGEGEQERGTGGVNRRGGRRKRIDHYVGCV